MDLRHIVSGLQGDPFRRDVTSVTLDHLNEQQRLQLLSDIICEIEGTKPNEGPDIHYEQQEATIERITKSLNNFNFDPEQIGVVDKTEFFSRLVSGDPYLIFKTLEYLVCGNVDLLKKRAYLAKFLVKIDIPQEFVGERDVSDVFMKYEAMIERFAETHKESNDGKSAGEQNPEENMTTEELRGELAKLDSEKSGLQLRLKEVKYRVQQALQHERDADKFIGTVKRLRLEEQKTSSIREQIGRVRREVMQLEQQLGSGGLRAELQHARDANDKSAVQLLEMAEADLAGLLFRKDKIFSLIDQKRGEMTHLQTIAHQTLFPRSELDALQNQIEAEQNRINQLMEAKVKRRQSLSKTSESTLTMYRGQAQAVTQKREALDSELNDRRHELHELETSIATTRSCIDEEHGNLENSSVSEETVTKIKIELKSKHDFYKQKRDERNVRIKQVEENKVMVESMSKEKGELVKEAKELENKYGVTGFITKVAAELAKGKNFDVENGNDSDELKNIQDELNDALGSHQDVTIIATIMEKAQRVLEDRKMSLKPLNEDVKNLRVEAAKLLNERAERKSQYDALQEQLDTTSAALESNVQGLRRSAAQEAERYYKIDNDLISKEAILERTRDKEKSDAYIKSLEGSLKTQEDRNRKLKSTLRQLRDTPTDKRKMQAWASLLSIFQAKNEVIQQLG